MLQLKGPMLIRMLAEYKNCPLKGWAQDPHLKSYFAMPHRNKAGPVHKVFLFVTLHKGPSNAPPQRHANHEIENRKQHLTPDPHSLSPSFKAIMKFEGGGNPP